MKWSEVAYEFVADGSLRDIYVSGTGAGEWQLMLDAFSKNQLKRQYLVNGAERDLPNDVGVIFSNRVFEQHSLTVYFSTIRFTSHFFSQEQIDFDLDPAEIVDQFSLQSVSDFMKMIGATTKRDVILTPEGLIESPILKYVQKDHSVIHLPLTKNADGETKLQQLS